MNGSAEKESRQSSRSAGLVRPLGSAELDSVAVIFHDAFNELYERRGYGPIVADAGVGRAIAETYLALDPEHCFVVTTEGVVAGSGFLHPRGGVAGVGPITIDPRLQGRGLGRLLVSEICQRADRLGLQSLRLIQDSFNESSYALYTRLGFQPRQVYARASFAALRGKGQQLLRVAGHSDLARIGALEKELLGFSRPLDYDLLRHNGEVFVLEAHGVLEGWLARLSRGSVTVLGPVLSRTSEGMRRLVVEASRDLPAGMEVRLLLPPDCHELHEELARHRVEIHSLCNYMVRGSFDRLRGYYAPTLFPESG